MEKTNPNTSILPWYQLVNDAENICGFHPNEEVESYVVFLLDRNTAASSLNKPNLGMALLESLQEFGERRFNHLQEIGDNCLLLAGLFPQQAAHRNVRVSYFINIGQAAYYSISEKLTNKTGKLYYQLAQEFPYLTTLLHCTREVNSNLPSLTPLVAFELWEDMEDLHAYKQLKKYTDNVIVRPDNKPKFV